MHAVFVPLPSKLEEKPEFLEGVSAYILPSLQLQFKKNYGEMRGEITPSKRCLE
jgi:hypothetical protein